jgi:ubiquinone/menaquinone biosynthesis C-methylase UbiE
MLNDKIQLFQMDMKNLQFEENSFDIIWSEGAIYNIGFEKGLSSWKKYLKPMGYIAVTEITWIKENPPKELLNFWKNAYPALQSVKGNLDVIKQCGYNLIEHFTLPQNAWWNYYNPIIKKLPALEEKYKNNSEALAVIEEEEFEIKLYRKYSDYYGYVFYIMQKQ